jgi:hypothetical protein
MNFEPELVGIFRTISMAMPVASLTRCAAYALAAKASSTNRKLRRD